MVLSTLVLGALTLVPGVPLALVIGRAAERRWSGVVVEALLLGLCWYLLLGLFEIHAGWFGQWQIAAPTLALTAALATPAVREARTIASPSPTWFSGSMVAITVVAMVVRTNPFYFIYQIGDFGEYVNRANSVADGGSFSGWFTQGFTVLLATTHLALGEANIVQLMPFLGVVLLLTTVALAERLGASVWARAVVAVIFAVGVVPVWFSRFPASETPYAVLQVAMVLFVVEAVQRSSTRLAVSAGMLCGLLLITRGNGLLLGPVIVVFLLISALVVERKTLDVLTKFAASALVALGAAFVYDARFSHPYFIVEQLPKFVPKAVFRQLEGMGGLTFAAPRLLGLLVVTAGLVWSARRLHERASTLDRVAPFVLPTIVVLALVALFGVMDRAGLVDALERYAIVVELLGALGIGVALWRFTIRADDGERVGVILVVLVCVSFALLYAQRLPSPRYAPYYLYWDRYLFSELFPLMVLSAIWSVWLIERGLTRVRVPHAVIWLFTLALGFVLWRGGELTREHEFMDDAYGELGAVAHLMPDRTVPIVFSGVSTKSVPAALHFPNTHRIVGLPLQETFGHDFLNTFGAPFGEDPRPTVDEITDLLTKRGAARAYLMQVAVGTARLRSVDGGARLSVSRVGSTTVDIPLLDRPVDGTRSHWTVSRLTVVVSTVARR